MNSTAAKRAFRESVLQLVKAAVGNPNADFRDEDQFTAINHLVNVGTPLLVVQRTGWGKSLVYFIAAKLLRERRSNSAPALLITPLISLMRNQLEAAKRMGISAETINSTMDTAEVEATVARVISNKSVDILLISPERLDNTKFMEEVLIPLAPSVPLFVVDEAHCMSDWGHDFRPDYQRIRRILKFLPPTVPVLATTATANDRVVEDLIQMIPGKLTTIRGSLLRKGLTLQAIALPRTQQRLAWLAEIIPTMEGSGIVYVLTRRHAKFVTAWLQSSGIKAESYMGGRNESEADTDENAHTGEDPRVIIEQKLLNNELKVVVATMALGMGFDKADLRFVIHYQRPASVVTYYQQVGRAGRDGKGAFGILLSGAEDDQITDYFINNAFPSKEEVKEVIQSLDLSRHGLSEYDLLQRLNLSTNRLRQTLKLLAVEDPNPIIKSDGRWQRTTQDLAPDFWTRVERLTKIRKTEQAETAAYAAEKRCLMRFLQASLDDPHAGDCGECANCNPKISLPNNPSDETLINARTFVRRSFIPIAVHKQLPAKSELPLYGWSFKKIPDHLRAEPGMALAWYRFGDLGDIVHAQRYCENPHFSDALATAAATMIERTFNGKALYITCIPSLGHPNLVPNLAQRIAAQLKIPFHPVVTKTRITNAQKEMFNSQQQAQNLDGAFAVELPEELYGAPLILIDDICNSGWTFAIAALLLKQAGSGAVFPVALAKS
jgi:ATP-dependent DNA helicase RecQ